MDNTQVIFITGTRKGIGAELAKLYANEGYCVAGCSRKKIDYKIDNYRHYYLDVADETEVKKACLSIKKQYGRLDILINNAGIASANHTLLTPVKTVSNIMSTNFLGTFLFSREAARLMKKNGFGRIINLVTVATPLNLEGEAIYASSKAAINSFSKILAKELAEFGITVNTVGPTPIKTDLIRSVPKDKIDHLINSLPIKRYGEVLDVKNVIDFFIRPESNYITGQIIYLGGV